MTPATPRILISGGGIAGPALAYWLARRGSQPTVVEHAPSMRTGGYRIQLEGAGIEALEQMGLLAEFREHGGPTLHRMRMHMRPGRPPLTLPGGTAVSALSGLSIKRGTAVELVHRLVPDDVEFLFDESVTALHEHDDGVTAHFRRSRPREFDLVVGADGLHSTVRSLVFGAEKDRLRFLGTNLALFTVENWLGLRDEMVGHAWPRRGCMLATYPGNEELEVNLLWRSPRPVLDREEHRRIVRQLFGEDGWHMPRVLAGLEHTQFSHFSPTRQVQMDSWSRGRVVLLGDAGYCPDPMTGQGTSLALVGAIVLAQELANSDGDHRTALRSYESVMRPFVDANHAMAGTNLGVAAPDTGPTGLRLRQWAYRGLFRAIDLFGMPPRAQTAYRFPASPAERS
jgi:2-polyprenyl-6-methoxyphenol hydroxylase-like FAD-dependent oxidoreductase